MQGHTYWEEEFARYGALWIHDGNPAHPHALLTSGKHSSGFFNATKVIEKPHVLERACYELLRKMLNRLASFPQAEYPRVVVGSAF